VKLKPYGVWNIIVSVLLFRCLMFYFLMEMINTHASAILPYIANKECRMDYDGLGLWFWRHFQHYFSYIVAVSFIGGGNRSTRRKPPTFRRSLTKLGYSMHRRNNKYKNKNFFEVIHLKCMNRTDRKHHIFFICVLHFREIVFVQESFVRRYLFLIPGTLIKSQIVGYME
jgi:hypothetical protein